METPAARLTCPGPVPQCENADKNAKLDSYGAADNAYNSRYKNMRRSYNVVRKIGKKVKFLEARHKGSAIREAAPLIPASHPSLLGPLACAIVPPNPSLQTRRA